MKPQQTFLVAGHRRKNIDALVQPLLDRLTPERMHAVGTERVAVAKPVTGEVVAR